MADRKNIPQWSWGLLVGAILIMIGAGCGGGRGINAPSSIRSRNLFDVAEESYRRKDFKRAEREYKEYLKHNPYSFTADNALFRLAEIAFANGEYPRSREFFQRVVKEYPESELLTSAQFEAVLALFYTGAFETALQELLTFQRDFPASQYSSQVNWMIAEIYLRNKQYQKVKESATGFLKTFPDSPLKAKVLYQLGLSELQLKETSMAQRHLRQSTYGELTEDEKLDVYYTLGLISLNKGDIHESLKIFSDFYKNALNEEKREWFVQKIYDLIKSQCNYDYLSEAINNYPNEFPGDLAILEMGDRRFKEGEHVEARYYWQMFVSNFPKHSQVASVMEKLASIEERQRGKRGGKFGCIAPLSGSLSGYGEKMVRGVTMAIEEYNDQYGASVKLVLFDSQATQDMAKKGVELLAYQENVAAIIGPLLTSTTIAAAEDAEKTCIPLFTPTATGDGITNGKRYIFRNCLTSSHQVDALAHYAVREMGIMSFGILYPSDSYGEEMMKLFTQRVRSLGAHVDIIESYTEEETDYKEQILRIHEIQPDALFLPGSYEKILLIAPQLSFYMPEQEEMPGEIAVNDPNLILQEEWAIPSDELDPERLEGFFKVGQHYRREKQEKKIQLLGTDGWYNERLIKEAGNYVEGAVVSVGFYPESNNNEVREFSSLFQIRYGEPPDLISAQSFDATNILLNVSEGGAASWEKIKEKLHKIRNFQGVTGKTTILPSGDSQKEVTLLQIQGKRFIQRFLF